MSSKVVICMLAVSLFIICYILSNAFYKSSFTTNSQQESPDPLLVVVIMVKNEESSMRETLLPFLEAGLQHYVVLDTGSIDNTLTVTQQAFQEYNVKHGYILEKPFVDFSTSRNYAISQAEQLFPHAKFMLMVDAEWIMHNVQGLIDFCKNNYMNSYDAFLVDKYMFVVKGQESLLPYASLLRAHKGVSYKGVVHEYLNTSNLGKVPSRIYFDWQQTNSGLEKSRKRWHKDKDLLLQELEKKPNDPRTLYYLGQTCGDIGEVDNACYWYKKRCEVSGWDEEDYLARYCLGNLYAQQGDWDQAIKYYMQAYEQRDSRVEPLVKIAQYYFDQQDYARAYLFALQAISLPMPHDLTFIDIKLYNFERYDLFKNIVSAAEQVAHGRQVLDETLQYYSDILSNH